MIKRQGLITSADDLVELGIIDWSRTNGTSRSPLAAMRDISSWFIGRAAYTVIDCDLEEFPERDDFPTWQHPGHHVGLARLYWNAFRCLDPEGELLLSDEPDFYGTFKFPEIEPKEIPFYTKDDMGSGKFWGDFGKVSASAFALTAIRKMEAHDLWISVLDYKTQIVIEPFESLRRLFMAQFGIK